MTESVRHYIGTFTSIRESTVYYIYFSFKKHISGRYLKYIKTKTLYQKYTLGNNLSTYEKVYKNKKKKSDLKIEYFQKKYSDTKKHIVDVIKLNQL